MSLEQIKFIMSCPDCPLDLYKQLDLALFKANNGHSTPAFIIKKDLAESLPMESAYKLALRKLEIGEELTGAYLRAYNEYRYTNDLMDAEEQAAYELEQGF